MGQSVSGICKLLFFKYWQVIGQKIEYAADNWHGLRLVRRTSTINIKKKLLVSVGKVWNDI